LPKQQNPCGRPRYRTGPSLCLASRHRRRQRRHCPRSSTMLARRRRPGWGPVARWRTAFVSCVSRAAGTRAILFAIKPIVVHCPTVEWNKKRSITFTASTNAPPEVAGRSARALLNSNHQHLEPVSASPNRVSSRKIRILKIRTRRLWAKTAYRDPIIIVSFDAETEKSPLRGREWRIFC
jgi:hypothetical protein